MMTGEVGKYVYWLSVIGCVKGVCLSRGGLIGPETFACAYLYKGVVDWCYASIV